MGVGKEPDYIDEETPADEGRDDGATRRQTRRAQRDDPGADGNGTGAELADAPARRGVRRQVSRDRALRQLLDALRAVDGGDFSVRLQANGDPLVAEVLEAFNRVAGKHQRLTDEMVRVSQSVGREGRMRDRVALAGASGAWAVSVDAMN
ncbi:MAG: hypothetical protein ABR499_01420, partial [Gemmatimonadaceae bacterium]